MNYERRLASVQADLGGREVDALLVTNLTNVRYLTGFSGSNGQVLVTQEGALFLTDPRYEARAADLVQGAETLVYPAPDALRDVLGGRLSAAGVTTLGLEAATMTLAGRDGLAAKLPGVELRAVDNLVEALRRSKDPDEIALVREAARLADEAFRHALERLTPGMTEREVALELEIHIRRAGADDVSFDPIVGSGELSAHIHHTASERELQKGDLVLMDLGARWKGYCSDLTRTVVLGPASDEQREVYAAVLEAQTNAIDAVTAGARGVDVDARAREVITRAGHGSTFGHGTGHGVGLDIHEQPRLAQTSRDSLIENDIVTVEPGIYLSGVGGIRIEDCVLVGSDGGAVLGSAPKDELIEL